MLLTYVIDSVDLFEALHSLRSSATCATIGCICSHHEGHGYMRVLFPSFKSRVEIAFSMDRIGRSYVGEKKGLHEAVNKRT